MGKSGKVKKSGASKAELKAQKKAKTAAKAERKEGKATKGAGGGAGGAGTGGGGAGSGKGKKKGKGKEKAVEEEEDLIETLAEFRRRWEEEHKTTEETALIPSRRANATLTADPLNTNQLWLYGGEYFDGTSCYFYPELYRYIIDKNEWRSLSSPTQPAPRSAHQVVPSPAGGGKLWLFGGEYASQNQTSFHHYRDLWAFDITTKAWERYDTKIKPSARSGHRMALWKQYLVLFGGFHDVGIRTTYLSDLWLWDTTEYRWHEVVIRDADRRPPARSGFSFLPCPDGILLHGGYCKEYHGKQVRGVALDDTWFLRMDPDKSKLKWERRKKAGYPPTVRSGVQMTYWPAKAMGIMFGGVHDSYDNDEEDLVSVFYDELFGYQTAANGRWVSLMLKRPKKKAGGKRAKKKAIQQIQQRGPDDEEEAHENGNGNEDEDDGEEGGSGNENHGSETLAPAPAQTAPAKTSKSAAPEDDEDDPDDPLKTVPIARYNAMMAVQKNTLYIYGGIVEAQNREFTLDDFYSLQLDKLERFVCHKECNIAELEWKESDSEDDSDESSSESDSDSETGSSSDDEEGGDEGSKGTPRSKKKKGGPEDDAPDPEVSQTEEEAVEAELSDLRKKATAFLGVSKDQARSPEDMLSTPLPGETLKTFYDRTREYWAQKAHEHSENRGKSLRRDGFGLADDRYQTYKPILEEIEKIQAEAGLEEEDLAKGGQAKAAGLGVDSRNRR